MSGRPVPQIQEPAAEHTHTVIFLHGGGSDGPQFWRAIRRRRPSLFAKFPSFRWVFPSSGLLWSSSMEMERKQWLDASPRDSSESAQEIPGLSSSVEYVLRLIEEEVQRLGGRADKLVLGGLSQGQATSLYALLRCEHRLGAYVGMSGWLPLAHKLDQGTLKEGDLQGAEATPVFLGHGTHDRKVPLELALRARHVLSTNMNVDVTWRQYVGAKLDGHWIKEPEELEDVAEFLQAKLQLEEYNAPSQNQTSLPKDTCLI
ncbi:acyl-protein thioesterase 1 [Selaginella moellendorffii]|nr:acyl-protein thioesterase 1 [Selaginella moellendorffii]|eukprot:XP_002993590.2 acyl-protein thioesterase 1 [Selaginella moellendorffii]